MRLLTTALLGSWLVAMAGCPVEPPDSSAQVGARDGGTIARADARPADAATDTCDGVDACPTGQVCARDGTCVAPLAACVTNDGCAAPELCVDGRCGVPEGGCTDDQACGADARCYPSGWCGPVARILDEAVVSTCRLSADCGRTGRCSFGVCAPCVINSDCPGARVCGAGGTCEEPVTCTRDDDCYAGNACVRGACAPISSGCRADPGNDTIAGALPLVEGATTTPTLCGQDTDWWAFSAPAGQGARVVVRTQNSRSGARVELSSKDGAALDVSSLELPGLSVLEISTATVTRELLLRVATLDASGPYAVALVLERDLCAGDALDLYGDRRVEDALEIPAGTTIARRACPLDVDITRVSAAAADRWSIAPRLVESGALSARVERLDGTQTTSVAASGRYLLGTTTVLSPRPAPTAESWAIVVETENVPNTGAAYTVAVDRLRGTRLQACAAAPVLAAGVSPVSLAGAMDLGGPVACDPLASVGALDRLVRIDPPRPGALLHLTARPTSTAARARVGLAILEQCSDDGSVEACDFSPLPGGGASLEHVMGVDPVWAVVSSTSAAEVALTVAFDERGDYTCRLQGATPILASGAVVVDTRAATDTVRAAATNACGLTAGDGGGPDRFFALDVGADDRAVLELVGPQGGLLWVSTDCARMSGTCAGAGESALGRPGRVVLPASGRAQTYVVAVDGLTSADVGTWELRTRLRPQCVADAECVAPLRCDDYACVAPPANDRCDGAAVVTLTDGAAVIEGSTGAARDDFVSPACASPNSAQDVVFAVDVPAGAAELRARITAATWDPIVSIRSVCGTSTAELTCDDDSDADLLPDARLARPAAGRYFVIVDGYAGAGPFTLELTAR